MKATTADGCSIAATTATIIEREEEAIVWVDVVTGVARASTSMMGCVKWKCHQRRSWRVQPTIINTNSHADPLLEIQVETS